MLYKKSELETMFFHDIETVAEYKHLDLVPEEMKEIWLRKYHFKHLEDETKFLIQQNILGGKEISTGIVHPTPNDIYLKYAALHAEFAKIINISFGIFDMTDKKNIKKDINSINGEDEKQLLVDFADLVTKLPAFVLTGYNISGFDIPFIIKRMIYHGIPLPKQFQIKGKKPWEITIHDIMVDWKLTGWEPITLDLLCNFLGIASPKDEIKNFQVSTYYHEGKISLDGIVKYGNKDIDATMNVVLKLVQ